MATKKTPAAEPEKKRRKSTSSYKNVQQNSTFGAVADAFSAIEELASECREIVDNASEGLSQTQRIQTFRETADTLEGLSEVDVPECLQDEELHYSEDVPRDKRRGASRAVRCSNAVAILQAAADRAEELKEDEEFKVTHADDWESVESDIDSFVSDLQNEIGSAEGCEFPGMYG